ncbi:MAG: GTP-binding protein [Candidatus Bathyarchaeota archaeon]|nr:GTP-binding protein [Candidatus Bathyarchaeota archaeon]
MPRINLVVVGHKDHGKSTLIGRLLYDSKAVRQQQIDEIRTELTPSGKPFEFAFLLDSLEEERQGGLTIDIMQTPFTSQKYLYTIIDCPGHREFIKKMLTGASQADAAVLVASAKEGVESQTRQHAFLIKKLGIQQLVVAINKMDAVAYRESSYKTIGDELTPLLRDLGYHHVPLIPVSAMNGDNVYAKTEKMTWHTGSTLIDALDETIRAPNPPANKPLRAVVQDIYPYEGNQTIIACKIETGTLQTQTNVVFNPLGQTGRLNQILVYGSDVERAEPGDPVGLIVDGVDAVERGDVLSYPHNQPNVVTHLVAEVILFSDTPLQEGAEITLRYGTAEKRCRVQKIRSEMDPVRLTITSQNPRLLRGNSVGVIELSAREPLCLEKYSDVPQLGRFIIEDKKGAVAAGIVLETIT